MDWEPPEHWPRIETVESHTGGEPLRVVVDGFPRIPGDSILAKRRYVREHHDDLRAALMLEPRGHADMYGAILTEPVTDDGDVGVLFTHNDGYSTMCGHGIVALGVVLPEIGAVAPDPERPEIRLDTPAGRVTAWPRTGGEEDSDSPADGRRDTPRVRRVAFENVPSYVVDRDLTVRVPGHGAVTCDLAFGGAYYAYCELAQFGLTLEAATHHDLVEIGRAVKAAVADSVTVDHPTDDDLSFLYGTILTGEATGTADCRNVCIFADGEVDRSPTGTGVSGHLALNHDSGDVAPGEEYVVESLVGSTFTGRVREVVDFEGHDAVVPEIEGSAHVVGTSTFTVDPADPFPEGFRLR
ncbi:MAG: proline racemase family protein [Haloarculaceae archaeon]